MRQAKLIGVDAALLMKDAARLAPEPTRRLLLRGALLHAFFAFPLLLWLCVAALLPVVFQPLNVPALPVPSSLGRYMLLSPPPEYFLRT